jgi:hypothetical protein
MNAKQYLARAEEMMLRAERAHTQEERLEYLFIASGWKNLAEAAQRAADAPPPPEPPEEP